MNELAITSQNDLASGTAATIMSPAALNALVEFSKLMAASAVTVPDHLKGKPADCLAVAMQAAQWGMNPFTVAQKTHIISGRLGYEAQLVNAVIQATGAIEGTPSYEYRGEGPKLECRVGCVLRGQHEITWGEWYCVSDVAVKNSPLWKTNPKQQLGYLQLKNWARLYAPGAILGVYTPDELETISEAPRNMGMVEEVGAPPPGPRRRSEAAAEQQTAATSASPNPETGEVPPPAAAAPAPAAETKKQSTAAGGITGGQVNYLRNKITSAGLDEQTFLDRYQVAGLELLNAEQFDAIKAELLKVA
jgi:hypothetical protein